MEGGSQTPLPTFGDSVSSLNPISNSLSPNLTSDDVRTDQEAAVFAPLPPSQNVNNNNGCPNVNVSVVDDEGDDATVTEELMEEDVSAADREFFRSLPPGYRFRPTDSELIVHYLQKKINKEPLPRHQIPHINLYRDSPDVISAMYPPAGNKEWFFLTPRNRKYPKGHRPNRAAGPGYWKATGADKPITHDNKLVGYRKSLVYFVGKSPKGKKTNWIMHEFRVRESKPIDGSWRLDDFVICKIYKKVDKSPQKHSGEEEEAQVNQNVNENENGYDFRAGEGGSQLFDPVNANDFHSSFEDVKDKEALVGPAQSSFNNDSHSSMHCGPSFPNIPPYYGDSHFSPNYAARPLSYISSMCTMENTLLSKYMKVDYVEFQSQVNHDNFWNMIDSSELPPVENLAELDTLINNFSQNSYETTMTTSNNVGNNVYPPKI